MSSNSSTAQNERIASVNEPNITVPESDAPDYDDSEEETDEFKQAMWAGQANIMVAVRLRPLLSHDRDNVATVKELENKMVVVLDPGNEKDVVGKLRKRNREKRFAFDHVFSANDGQNDVYKHTTKFLIHGILNGFNATVFAYGQTGSGKTHTMLGTPDQPGIMALTLEDLFRKIEKGHADESFSFCYKVTVSFLEVYNENIRDLLVNSKECLDLREDPVKGPIVSGITELEATSAAHVMTLLRTGNKNRSQEATAANAVSSRSHAVLQVLVEQREKAPGRVAKVKYGKLSMIDLAGSERAANTKNRGQRLIEGANINRSLLALGNCINALGEQKSSKKNFVPYRDSKLTRLLKDSLGGNCRTVMIANISMAKSSFEETLNTLKYANRAKNIKTTVTRNVLKVNYHITEYVSLIDGLKGEILKLKGQLGNQTPRDSTNSTATSSHNNNHDENQSSTEEFKNTRNQVLSNYRKRMLLRRDLIEMENQNVASSIEVGKHQLMVKEFERQLDVDDETSPLNPPTSDEEEPSEVQEAQKAQLTEQIETSKDVIKKYKKAIKSNKAKKDKLSAELKQNEIESENFMAKLEHTSTSEERKELLLMEYRIGKLELEKMELEQSRTVHDSIVRGKDLTIQKLKLELQLRNKVIEQQQAALEKNNLDGAVQYGILNSLEEATLSEGFDTLRASMNRITTPPVTNADDLQSTIIMEEEDSGPEEPTITKPAVEDNNNEKVEDSTKSPSFLPEIKGSTTPRDEDEYAVMAFPPKQKEAKKNYQRRYHVTSSSSSENTSPGNRSADFTSTSLPYIRVKKKTASLVALANPYLRSIKKGRKKREDKPENTNVVADDESTRA